MPSRGRDPCGSSSASSAAADLELAATAVLELASALGLPEERAAREEECQIIRIFIQPELEVYIQNTSEKMHVNARKCMN